MKRTPSEWAAIAALALAVICCCGTILAWTAVDALGWAVTAPLRWFQGRGPEELTLRRVLEREQEAIFTLGEGCAFTFVQGTVIGSQLDPATENGFARDLSRDEVVAALRASLQEIVFIARDGELALNSGTPIRSSLLPDDQVSIGFDEQQATETTLRTRSLDGSVSGNTFTGTFHVSESTSTVIGGEGREESISLNGEMTCPLRWLSSE
jgi:hypothetical protein